MNTIRKLFITSALMMTSLLSLGACNNKDGGKTTPTPTPTGGQVTPTPTPTPTHSTPIENSFPSEELRLFLQGIESDAVIPTLVTTSEWTFDYDIDFRSFEATTPDNGTVGVDALEDQYFALFKSDSAWETHKDLYDKYGYLAFYDDITVMFYTEENVFFLKVLCGYGRYYATFPEAYLNSYLQQVEINVSIPTPISSYLWNSSMYDDEVFGGLTFYAASDDDGSPGEDAIEDTFKQALKDDDWFVDESVYEEDGYYAYKENAGANFYSFYGTFYLYIYVSESN